MARQNMTLAEKVADVLEDLSAKIREAFDGLDPAKDERAIFDALRAVVDQADEIAERWSKGIAAAVDGYNAVQTVRQADRAKTGEIEQIVGQSEQKESAPAKAQKQIMELEDGRKYVDVNVDQQLFDGLRMDEAMMEMADSIRQYGVLVPGMVRQKPDGGYEMIAGHRRKMASELAQKETMPCLVRDLSDDEAIIIMIDSNLQRETLLPSEKAFACKMKLEAMKRQPVSGPAPDHHHCPRHSRGSHDPDPGRGDLKRRYQDGA